MAAINPGFEVGKEYVIWTSDGGKYGSIKIGKVQAITNISVLFEKQSIFLEYFDPVKFYVCCFCFEEITSESQKLFLSLKAKKIMEI